MVLDSQRHRLDWWLVPIAKYLRNVNPNVFTWLSLLAAAGAGVTFYLADSLALLLAGFGLVFANGVLDVLDGKVAKMTGRQTAKGDYLDHAIDRFADTFFIAGLALGPFGRVEIGMAALAFTLLTSYLGTQAQAVGIGRNYGGLLGRADRMFLLMLVPIVQGVLVSTETALPSWWSQWSPSLVDTMLIYFAVAGAVSTVQRFVFGLGAFDGNGDVERD